MKGKPFLSIIIPAYNAENTLPALLDSIFTSKTRDFEVIVVDDASPQNLRKTVSKFSVAYYRLKVNSGPAKARDFGVKKAAGEVILFLDADVVVGSKTLAQVIDIFKKDSKLVAATGVWNKKQKSISFFPNFKALRDWSYWIHERNENGLYFLFSPRIAAIKKEIFQKLGGFNPKYKGADVEDIELTYKIAEEYSIRFDEKMIVEHEFGGFYSIAKGYFRRSSLWIPLFLKRLKFDPVATTGHEALATTTAFSSFVFLFLGLSSSSFFWLALVLLFVHLYLVRGFLRFVLREKGFLFMIKSLIAGYIFYLIIFSGAVMGVLFSVADWLKRNEKYD